MPRLKREIYVRQELSLRDFHRIRNKVLVLHDKGGLGDALMIRMLARNIKRCAPGCHLAVACLPEYIEAVSDHPMIDEVVDSRTAVKSEYIAIFNTCVSVADRYENMHAPHYTDHRSDIWGMACGIEMQTHSMDIVLDEVLRSRTAKHMERYRVPNKPLVGLAPISKMAKKTLLPQHLSAIRRRLSDCGLVALHNKPSPECERAGIPVVGGGSMKEWMCQIDAMDYVISVDTAAFHLAGGLGKPLCGIFTFANGKVYGKYYDFVLVQKHRDNGDWDCGPCFKFGECKKSKHNLKPCLTELTGEEIVRGIDKMFEKWSYKTA